jgi:hypothetical protein
MKTPAGNAQFNCFSKAFVFSSKARLSPAFEAESAMVQLYGVQSAEGKHDE